MIHIKEMSFFMHKYTERIVGAKGDGNCVYHVVSAFLGKREENHTLVRRYLSKS